MTINDDCAALMMALIYPVQFDKDPTDDAVIDRVIERVINIGTMDATPDEFLQNIRIALSSDEILSRLIPQEHSEDVIRSYFAKLESRLARVCK